MTSRFFNVSMAGFTLIVLGICVVGGPAAEIRIPKAIILPTLAPLLLMLLLAAYAHWRNGPTLVDMCLTVFWSMVVPTLAPLPMYMAARTHVPMQDALLAGFDRSLGLEVPKVLHALQAAPWLKQTLDYFYGSLILLMVLAMILVTLRGKSEAAKEYLVAIVIAAVITVPFTAVFQAVGPWHYYGFSPNAEQAKTMKIFFQLKTAGWFTLDSQSLAGLIAFPSFHTILALLAALALWRVRYVRWLALVWAGLILVSTLTTGWHYIADVLGGIGLTAVAALAARGYTVLEKKWASAATFAKPNLLATPASAPTMSHAAHAPATIQGPAV